MRSFIKSHRRNDSNQSDTFESSISDYQPPPSLPSTTSISTNSGSQSNNIGEQNVSVITPNPSPRLHQSSQFTLTPPNLSNNPSSSLSSPKKLLSPIKNLFSSGSSHSHSHHHSKPYHSSTTVNNYGASPSSGTSLNNILHSSSGTLEKLKHKKLRHTRSHTSISNISELTSSSVHEFHSKYTNPSFTTTTKNKPSSKSSSNVAGLAPPPVLFNSTSSPALVNSKGSSPIGSSPSQTSINSYHSANSHLASSSSANQSQAHIIPTTQTSSSLSREQPNSSTTASSSIYQANNSIVSSTQSLNNFERKQVSFDSSKKTTITNTTTRTSLPIDSDTTQVESTNDTPLDENESVGGSNIKKVKMNLVPHTEEGPEGEAADGTSSDTSSSSQFSFVRDRKGGRNTSVKYYKSKDSASVGNNFAKINTFSEHDLGYEVDEYSDYDFENNGMDDDEGDDEDGVFGDNDEDDEIQYNKVFDDDDDDEDEVEDQSSVIEHKSGLGSNEVFDNELNLYDQDDYEDDYENYDDDIPGDDEDDDEFISYNKAVDEDVDHNLNPFPFKSQIVDDIPSTPYDHPYQIPFPSQPTTQKPFNSSYHLSISGIDFSEEIETLTNDNNGSGDDILENYLDVMTKSSSSIEKAITTPVAIRKTPELKSVDNLELFDISSPIINGLTIGHNLKHKLMRPGSNHSSKKSSRQTFINRRDSDGIKGEEEDNVSQKQLKIDYGGNEVFKVHSFHQSIGDDLDLKIKQKVNNMEEFHNTIYKSQIKSPEVGLGIETPDSVHDVTISNKTSVSNNSMRKSISSMMDLLSSLESSQTASSRKNSGSNNKDANISTSSFQSDQRKSIVGMMSLLADLEKNQSEVEHSTDKSSDLQKDKMKENRKSINDMMSTLAKLEQSDSNASTSTLKKRRDSISHMMSTLAKLDVSNSSTIRKPKVKDPTIATRRIVSTPINSSKRYSWFNNDEDISINKSGSSTTSNKEDSGHNWDQDMLDEINQLPEDFDFQDHDYKRKLLNKVQDNNNNGFLRSNSYNKKPIRTVMDNKFQTNKIETLNKTVTFYRNSSLGLELGRSGSVSRATSTRSMNSFASVNEEASVEDDYEDHNDESSTFPYERVDSNTVTSNTNLMTITETDSPYLK